MQDADTWTCPRRAAIAFRCGYLRGVYRLPLGGESRGAFPDIATPEHLLLTAD
jgi:hypothetical protein